MADITVENMDDVRVERPDGSVAVRVGFFVTLYFSNPANPQVRSQVGRAIDNFVRLFGSQIKWLRTEHDQKPKKVNGLTQTDCQRTFQEWPLDMALEFQAHDATRVRDAPLVQVRTFAPFNASFEQQGYVCFSIAAASLVKLAPGGTRNFVQQICETIQPFHGYAGLGALRSPNAYAAREDEALALPLVQQFVGLELDAPIFHIDDLLDGIKGVNWITIVSDRLAAKIGGNTALFRQANEIGLETMRFSTGSLYLAGPFPEFGDLEGTGVPTAYQRASNLLKPLRVALSSILMNSRLKGIDADAFTKAWQARLD